MKVELSKTFSIDAAHYVPGSGGPGERLHGHTFNIEIIVEGEVTSPLGWLIDYGDLTALFKPLRDVLDHHCLNNVEGLDDPSLEGLAQWIQKRLAPGLPLLKAVRVSVAGANAFEVDELRADPERGLPRRVRFTFEAAQSLPQLPSGHKCRGLHGHSYRVEVGASDLARLRNCLPELYDTLDHRYLNDIPGLESATAEQISQWIWDWLSEKVDDLKVVVVQETSSARCTYYGR